MRFLFCFLLLLCSSYSLSAETLKFWQFWPEGWMRPAIEQFEKENPGVEVLLERLTWSDGYNKIITSMAANHAPDVIEVGSTWIAGLSADGGLIPLNPESLLNELSQWKSAKVDGKYYAYPWTVSTGALFVNNDLLKKVGIHSNPRTWSELLLFSEKINKLRKDTFGYGLKTGSYTTWQKFLPFVWSNGGKVLLSKSLVGVTEEPFLESVRFYKKLRLYSLYDDNVVVRKKFKEGKVGFMIEEPGQVLIFKKEAPDLNFSVIPLPASDKTGKSINFAGGQMLAVTKNTKNPKLAEKLIQFLIQKKVVERITHKITTLFPARKGIEKDDFYLKKHPELLVFLNVLKTSTAPEPHIRWIDLQESLSENLERVLYNKSEVLEAMSKAKIEMEKIMAEELY